MEISNRELTSLSPTPHSTRLLFYHGDTEATDVNVDGIRSNGKNDNYHKLAENIRLRSLSPFEPLEPDFVHKDSESRSCRIWRHRSRLLTIDV